MINTCSVNFTKRIVQKRLKKFGLMVMLVPYLFMFKNSGIQEARRKGVKKE